jgi:hypothetical protein
MGSAMMVPVPFVLWMLGTAFFTFCLFLIIKAITGGWGVGEPSVRHGTVAGRNYCCCFPTASMCIATDPCSSPAAASTAGNAKHALHALHHHPSFLLFPSATVMQSARPGAS